MVRRMAIAAGARTVGFMSPPASSASLVVLVLFRDRLCRSHGWVDARHAAPPTIRAIPVRFMRITRPCRRRDWEVQGHATAWPRSCTGYGGRRGAAEWWSVPYVLV